MLEKQSHKDKASPQYQTLDTAVLWVSGMKLRHSTNRELISNQKKRTNKGSFLDKIFSI